MKYLWIAVALGLGGCASVQHTEHTDLAVLRAQGDINEVPANAPSFERGF